MISSIHYSNRLYSDSNNRIGESLSEPILNQYHHFAIITTATTPIKRAATVIASHLTESTHTRSMSIATDTIEHTNTLSNERHQSTLLSGRVAVIFNETAASSNYDSSKSIEKEDNEL